MENTLTINNPYLHGNNNITTDAFISNIPEKKTETCSVFEKLVSEGGENFLKYIELLGLSNDQNLIILSSLHHYYFDQEDLKDIKTVLNIKHLNQIRQLKVFLHTIYHMLPDKSNFIGSFIDGKHQNGFLFRPDKPENNITGKPDPFESGIESAMPFIYMIYNMFDIKTNRYITRKTATMLLEVAGLAVTDMTELRGVTYFCSIKAPARA